MTLRHKAESITLLTDMIHELLNGPDGESFSGEGAPERMRIMLDVPKGLVLLAAWLHATERARRGGEDKFARFHERGDAVQWEALLRPARLALSRMVENALHMELHGLCTDAHPYFSPPETKTPANEPDDGLPF